MNKYQILFLHFVFFSCTPITETNWSFLPPVVNSWESIQSYGGREEDIAKMKEQLNNMASEVEHFLRTNAHLK